MKQIWSFKSKFKTTNNSRLIRNISSFSVKTLKSTIEHEYGIPASKQILLISGGELLDDDAVQVCMKIRETSAGIVRRFVHRFLIGRMFF